MTPWKRIVTLAGVGCLIAGAALAQQQIRPPNAKSTPQPPNTPLEAPSHWGPPFEQRKERSPETTQQKPPKALKPPKPPRPPKPPVDAKKKPLAAFLRQAPSPASFVELTTRAASGGRSADRRTSWYSRGRLPLAKEDPTCPRATCLSSITRAPASAA
jgi:hypothetical protein